MGQESLNFEEIKQPRISKTHSITENISNSEITQARELQVRLSKENKYKFIEDVPDFEKKLKKYKLNELVNEKSEKKKLFFYDSMQAAMLVRDINDEFGDRTAIYKDSTDPYGRRGFFVNISKPFRAEFEEILDTEGKILPNRENVVDLVKPKENETFEEDFGSLQKAS